MKRTTCESSKNTEKSIPALLCKKVMMIMRVEEWMFGPLILKMTKFVGLRMARRSLRKKRVRSSEEDA